MVYARSQKSDSSNTKMTQKKISKAINYLIGLLYNDNDSNRTA